MSEPVINLEELEYKTHRHGDGFEAQTAAIANLIGADKLGYQMVKVPPGKSAWPCHAHLVNEEMFFILDGEGIFIQGGVEHTIKPGDVISAVVGRENAHEMINTGDSTLVYLAVSTMQDPEVVFYPNSDKFGVIAGSAPGRDDGHRELTYFGRESSKVSYWDGEE